MRDPNRIEPFMQKLTQMWRQHVPDWRFGQLMSNFLGYVFSKTHRDIFFIEDSEMEKLVLDYFEHNKAESKNY